MRWGWLLIAALLSPVGGFVVLADLFAATLTAE